MTLECRDTKLWPVSECITIMSLTLKRSRANKNNCILVLQSKGTKRGQALSCLKVEDEHCYHGKPGVLDLSQLQPLELGLVWSVKASADIACQGQWVEELAARVALLSGSVAEIFGCSGPWSGPLQSLCPWAHKVCPSLALHPAHQEQLCSQKSSEWERSHSGGVSSGFEPRHTTPGLADEYPHHGSHGPSSVD